MIEMIDINIIKDLFIGNSNELSQLIDKYLIPQELEKKTNTEVSTPYKLRNEMLDKIPNEFWTKSHKVFEPCAGKGFNCYSFSYTFLFKYN
jgi:hypothetical protein